jgi:hypothetical protein
MFVRLFSQLWPQRFANSSVLFDDRFDFVLAATYSATTIALLVVLDVLVGKRNIFC